MFRFSDVNRPGRSTSARDAGAYLDVRLEGGRPVIRDFLAAGLINSLQVAQVPIPLGPGVRLWDGIEAIDERNNIKAVSSPSAATHTTFPRR